MVNEAEPSSRLLSLDAFRGLTIVGMILVNNPGSWSYVYWPLGHAAWHGWTPTDLIFPFFLFIVGTSLAYSLRKYREGTRIDPAVYWRIARRTAVLILLGLLLNSAGMTFRYLSGESDVFSVATLRLPGVLQRIALVYCAAALIVLHVGVRSQVALAAVLLLGYWALLAWLPNPTNYEANLSPEGNVVRVVDRALLGESHMYVDRAVQVRADPEGLLSTFPAIVTALLGYWTGLIIQRCGCNGRSVGLLVAAGAGLTLAALLWDVAFPINKKLWTSSFVLLTGGLAMIVLAGCVLKFDVWGWRRMARPWEIVGINAIFVYVAAGLVANLLIATRISGVSPKQWLYETVFVSSIGDPYLASLGYALTTVVFWWLVLWLMAGLRWSIRV